MIWTLRNSAYGSTRVSTSKGRWAWKSPGTCVIFGSVRKGFLIHEGREEPTETPKKARHKDGPRGVSNIIYEPVVLSGSRKTLDVQWQGVVSVQMSCVEQWPGIPSDSRDRPSCVFGHSNVLVTGETSEGSR